MTYDVSIRRIYSSTPYEIALFLEYTGYIVLPCIYQFSLCRCVGHVATFPQLYDATKLPYVFHFSSNMLCGYITILLQLSQLLFCPFLDYAKQLYCLFTFTFVTMILLCIFHFSLTMLCSYIAEYHKLFLNCVMQVCCLIVATFSQLLISYTFHYDYL